MWLDEASPTQSGTQSPTCQLEVEGTVKGTQDPSWRLREKGSGWKMRTHHFLFLGSFSSFLLNPTFMSVCVCVYVCVGAWSCVRACMSEKEGALAPESALWGDHSCTLPAANWSLSSCPIHLHFLPITEHYLCSQLGMGLNPFWLSWCYSLQISNGDGEGRAGGMKRRGKVYGSRSRGHKLLRRQSPKLPIVPLQREALSARWRHRKENNYGRNQLLAL